MCGGDNFTVYLGNEGWTKELRSNHTSVISEKYAEDIVNTPRYGKVFLIKQGGESETN